MFLFIVIILRSSYWFLFFFTIFLAILIIILFITFVLLLFFIILSSSSSVFLLLRLLRLLRLLLLRLLRLRDYLVHLPNDDICINLQGKPTISPLTVTIYPSIHPAVHPSIHASLYNHGLNERTPWGPPDVVHYRESALPLHFHGTPCRNEVPSPRGERNWAFLPSMGGFI